MVEHLRRAAQEDPRLDDAGPDRVLALVLVRAPAWPVGPGDPAGAVEAARRAVQVSPDHAPNELALGEALLASGAVEEGREAARRAVALARAAGGPEAAGWAAEGEKLLARSAPAGGASG
jgi:Flp pilus assembly protein TadD